MARPRAPFAAPLALPLIATLAAVSWVALAIWQQSPYARLLDHGGWTEAGLAGALCAAVPGGSWLVPALLHAAAWLLMIAAMMLPTTWPLLALFRRIVAERADASELIALLVLGYLLAWIGFGLAAHLLDRGLHEAAVALPFIGRNGWIVGAGLVGLAGAFQFSALKYRCLDRCRSPLGFVMQHWRGPAPRREAFRLGLDHGLFCVGCCWALMLLMFAVGLGSILWMLALGSVMAAEKNAPWGRRIAHPLGAALLAWSAAIAASHMLA